MEPSKCDSGGFLGALHVHLYHKFVNVVNVFGIHHMLFEYIFNEEYSNFFSLSIAKR